MAQAIEYRYLYYFRGASAAVEIEVTSLEEGTALDRVYHWLYISGGEVLKLQFESLREEDGRHYREFAQGGLAFDGVRAELKLDAAPVELAVAGVEDVPAELDVRVRDFLRRFI